LLISGLVIMVVTIYWVFEELKYYCIGLTISFIGFYIKQNIKMKEYDSFDSIYNFIKSFSLDFLITVFVIFFYIIGYDL